ncbi:unnamed protein product [Protopolystoma xenopodis]|uniref:Secreted protein n=1 Tax=Protopolystoma xenopodis TaxID=117903 RepID=A0A448XCW1_9PLAT|nr:unnamed protein product [Protopolystoma xenopodis]
MALMISFHTPLWLSHPLTTFTLVPGMWIRGCPIVRRPPFLDLIRVPILTRRIGLLSRFKYFRRARHPICATSDVITPLLRLGD